MAYVYRHIRLDKNVPFYIGISKKDDAGFKRAYSACNSKRNKIWMAIASKTSYEVEILFYDIDIEFAKKKEIELIALYGRICCNTGTLANIGGGGEPMFDPPDYLRKILSEKNKGKNNYWYGKKVPDEIKRKMSEARRGVPRLPLSKETKRKISIAHKGKPTWIKGVKQPEAALKRSGINHRTYKGEILCYDLNMNLVREFSCSKDIIEYFQKGCVNDIRRVLIGERNCWNNHVFRYKDEKLFAFAEERAKERKEQGVINNKKPRPSAYKSGVLHPSYKGPFICYDKDGNFVKEFLTTKEAAEYLGATSPDSISRVLKGNQVKSWNGYQFIYN
jgi:hypothetical protein